MATYRKRGEYWQVQIRKRGHPPQSRTFDTKAQGQRWAVMVEREMDERGITSGKNITAEQMLEKYRDEVCPLHRGEREDVVRINRVIRDCKWVKLRCEEVLPDHIRAYRDERLQQVGQGTVKRELGVLSGAFNHAIKEGWVSVTANPVSLVKRPSDNKPRSRRVSDAEIDAILLALGYTGDGQTVKDRVGLAFLFAIETAMRSGEIINLTWEHVFEKRVHLPKTKNGKARDVPLSSKARSILDVLRKLDLGDPVFQLTTNLRDTEFREATIAARCADLHFHDARREATTRLAKVLPVETLCRMTGHTDMRIMLSTYYRPDMSEVADLLA